MKPFSFRLLATLALGLNLTLTSAGAAADPVPFGSAPPGLGVGSQYRLIVITTGSRDASSTLISDYNSFATTEANATPALAALGTSWTAVASTAAVDARDNTGTNREVSTGVPFYGRDGLRLAANNLALWSASNGTPNTLENLVTDGNGNTVSAQMWTGTGNNGDGVSGPLGQGGADWGTANSLTAWITGNNAGQNPALLKRFYAMSGLLEVVAAAPTVITPTNTAVTVSSATLGGNVTNDGGAAITERGVVYALTSANADPQVGGSGVTAVTASGTTGMFTAPVSGLSASMDYSFKAYATNSAGTSYTSVATFTTNFAPTDLALTPSSIAENNAANATVGTLSATDTAGDTHLFTLAGGTDVGSFTIVGAALKLTPSADFETKSSYAITVRATDQGGLFFDKLLTVTISNANEMPSFTKGANQSHHNGTGAAQSVSGWATALNDGDSTVVQTLTFNITGNTNAGLFTTAPAVSSAGVLTYTPNGTPGTATISVTLRDDATINSNAALTTAAQTFTITVQQYAIGTTASMSASRQGATATLLPNGKVLVAGGSGGGATAEIYDPITATWTATGSMTASRAGHTATLLLNGKVLVAGGSDGANAAISSAELYDPATGTWSATGAMTIPRQAHVAALLPNGKVLVAGGVTTGNVTVATSELYDPTNGTWTPILSMSTMRNGHSATVLTNGTVLVAAGRTAGNTSELVSAELYDPATGFWSATAPMIGKRCFHTATLLPDGKVLVAGGFNASIVLGNLDTAQVYDPVAGSWSSTANNLGTGRKQHTASLLPNGKVLLAGGDSASGNTSSLEIYNPATGLFSAAGNLAVARSQNTATMLANGKVLIAGGGTASAELYEVAVSSWANTGSLGTARNGHSTTLLPDGKALVTGGYPSTQATPTGNSEVYDPALGTWTVTGSLNTARYYHTAILLRNGKVLVAGGDTLYNQGGATNSAELFDPTTGLWTATGVMNTSGEGPLTMLSDGKVLFSGRNGNSDLYDPATGLWTAKGVITSGSRGPASALPNGRVLSVGNSTASLYEPSTGLWTLTGTPVSPSGRADGSLTLLPNGKILLAGGFANNTCELYNPASGTWAMTGSLSGDNQYGAGVVLLPNGKVLHAGGTRKNLGTSYSSVTTSALYDPVTGVWTQGASLPVSQGYIHPGVALLPNGKVIFPGGGSPGTTARLFDPGLGFSAAWQPVISTFTSPLISGGSLALTGTGFLGVSGASSGGTADSSSDHPVVQLRSMENPQFTFLHATDWSDTACTSDALGDLPPGWMMVTAFVNGIPGTSSIAYFDSPEMDLLGNNVSIADGDSTPGTADHTDFGNAVVTTGSVVRTFTISNSAATLPLILTGTPSVSVSGTHAANFSVSLQPSTPVAAAASTTFQVTFVPSAGGLHTATLTIANDDVDEPSYDIAIQGTGVVPNYTVTTTGNAIVVTDVSGTGETLAISEPSAGNLKFAAAGRNFSVDGVLAVIGESGTLSRSGVTQITVNAGAGTDILNVGAFTGTLPSLTLNGGTGDDTVNFNGDLTFAADANLDVDLQNDDATPGTDIVNTAANANLLTSGTGTITVKVSKNVAMASGSSFETVNGGITVQANQQTTATVANFTGIDLNNAVVKTSGTGNVNLTAKGGNSTGSNRGIVVQGGGSVQSPATGLGAGQGLVSLTGTGSGTGNGYGVQVTGAGSKVISADGNITIIGQASLNSTIGGSIDLMGVRLESSAVVQSTGAAKVDITGTGGNSTGAPNYSRGVQISATITSVTGDITITGQGGTSAGGNQAIGLSIQGGLVESTGSAKITMNGTGGNTTDASGVDLGGSVQSVNGDITIIGQLGTPNTSLGGGHSAFRFAGGSILSSGIANVTVRADYMNLASTINAGANTVTLHPKTTGRLINLGGTDVINTTLGLLDAELDLITAGTLTIGDANSGNLTVSAAITRPASTSVALTSGGNILFNPGTLNTGGGSLTLTPGAAGSVQPVTSGTEVTTSAATALAFGAGSDLAIAIAGTTVDTQYRQLNVAGLVNLSGVDLVLSGAFVPTAGQTFTIVNNDAADAITGTFTGLAEGAVLQFNGVPMVLTYLGGDGNDVMLTAVTIIEGWRQTHLGTTADAGNAADTANPDSDALTNLQEFGFGTDPNVNDSSALIYAGTLAGGGAITKTGQPTILFEPSGNGVDFRALFVRRKDYVAAGLTYTPQFSARLTTWQNSAATPAVLADDGTYQIVSVPYPPFIAGQKARYFRIGVSVP